MMRVAAANRATVNVDKRRPYVEFVHFAPIVGCLTAKRQSIFIVYSTRCATTAQLVERLLNEYCTAWKLEHKVGGTCSVSMMLWDQF